LIQRLGVSNLCRMVCIILFDVVFYKIVPWDDWSSALFLIACKWYSSCVWIGLICDYTSLSSKEPNKISYEEWKVLWMDISLDLVKCCDRLALLKLIAVRILLR
jgi:hypothetical protein